MFRPEFHDSPTPAFRRSSGRARGGSSGTTTRNRVHKVTEQKIDAAHNPSFGEWTAALQSLRPAEPQGLNKHISTIVVAAALGIGAWLLSGVNSVQNTLVRVSTTLEAVKESTTAVSVRVEALSVQQTAIQQSQASLEQRVVALERSRPSR